MREGELIDRRKDEAFVTALREAGGFGGREAPAAGPASREPGAGSREGIAMSLAEIKPLVAAETPVRGLRPVKALNMAGVDIAPRLADGKPVFEWVKPSELMVDDVYQRSLSEKSVALVRKIVAGWDWKRFKPPVVARTAAGLEVIDGQHTAIAAASHPDVAEIPVMIVEAPERSERALAFVGHNRDRLGITPMQLHFAAVAAGDEDAQTIDQVCQRAGVTILRSQPAANVYRPCDTVSVNAIGALVNRRGVVKARQTLEVLANARCAPVGAMAIKAVEMLLFDAEYAGQVAGPDITSAILALGEPVAQQEAKVFAAAHTVPVWRALAVILFRRSRRGRRRAD